MSYETSYEKVEERLDALDIEPTDDVYLAYLFVQLGWLEELAVRMAERHEAVPGQLEDEYTHREAFWRAAGIHGGPIEPIRNLINWTDSLRGEAQMAILNLIAEVWLEGVLKTLGEDLGAHQYAPLFRSIAEDEKRHTEVEIDFGDVDPAPYVREMERHLHAITADPRFLWPLYRELGRISMVHMAKELHEAHQEACDQLGIGVGRHFKELLRCRQEAEDDKGVVNVCLDTWRRSAFNMDLDPMEGTRRIRWDWDEAPAQIEARFVRAAHRTLAFHPEWHLTVAEARKQMYRPAESCVGVRKEGRPGVVTAYTRACEDLEVLERHIRRNGARARQAAVVIPEITPELLEIQPPPRMAVVFSHMPDLHTGLAPMVWGEGVVWNIVIGELIDGHITIRCHADHRAVDGADLTGFLQELEYQLGVRNG